MNSLLSFKADEKILSVMLQHWDVVYHESFYHDKASEHIYKVKPLTSYVCGCKHHDNAAAHMLKSTCTSKGATSSCPGM